MSSKPNSMQTMDLGDLLSGLSSRQDGPRKMAAFKLQTLSNDPSFAEHFAARGGLPKLRDLILETSGNTQAYGLSSFARLLEVDQGWDVVDGRVVEKAVELVVSQPLVNILRGAMAVLASIVSRPQPEGKESGPYIGGFKALKPAIQHHPQFLEMLVSRLSSADHALCANALQLINSLMRDAIGGSDETEWPKFIKRIQDLGVIKAVYVLMQSTALQDLAHPLLEFQQLTKVLLGRWRDVPVDIMKPEHRRTIKAIHLASNPPDKHTLQDATENGHKSKHDPYKWRRLGFTTENPEPDFEDLGFLGMMDLSDYVRKNQDEFQNILAEQTYQLQQNRCPLARASLTITAILFEHFEVDKMEEDEEKVYALLESRTNYEKVFRPVLLHWNRLHIAGLHAFLRLWKETGAEMDDFFKIMELVRILVESVVGGAERTKGIEAIEQELATFDCKKLRALQMELLDLTYEDVWGPHLRGAKDELHAESLQFVREQRIRCLLEGAWFPHNVAYRDQQLGGPVQESNVEPEYVQDYRFIKLSPDRRYLHWANFEDTDTGTPNLGQLPNRIDLAVISSVVSNISAGEQGEVGVPKVDGNTNQQFNSTKITIHGYEPVQRSKGHSRTHSRTSSRGGHKEVVLLTFQPQNHTVASEWLDGLLMLLDQQPITAETNKIINLIADMGLKVRLLNVRGSEEGGMIGGLDGVEPPPVPSREGLDEDYYYEI